MALPLFVIGSVPGVFITAPVHWWFLSVATLGSLISGLANLMIFLRLRNAEQAER